MIMMMMTMSSPLLPINLLLNCLHHLLLMAAPRGAILCSFSCSQMKIQLCFFSHLHAPYSRQWQSDKLCRANRLCKNLVARRVLYRCCWCARVVDMVHWTIYVLLLCWRAHQVHQCAGRALVHTRWQHQQQYCTATATFNVLIITAAVQFSLLLLGDLWGPQRSPNTITIFTCSKFSVWLFFCRRIVNYHCFHRLCLGAKDIRDVYVFIAPFYRLFCSYWLLLVCSLSICSRSPTLFVCVCVSMGKQTEQNAINSNQLADEVRWWWRRWKKSWLTPRHQDKHWEFSRQTLAASNLQLLPTDRLAITWMTWWWLESRWHGRKLHFFTAQQRQQHLLPLWVILFGQLPKLTWIVIKSTVYCDGTDGFHHLSHFCKPIDYSTM